MINSNCVLKNESYFIKKYYYFNRFNCAAEAYNYTIENSNAEIYVFVHQDIKLLENDFWDLLIDKINNNSNSIFGLCGSFYENKKNKVFSNVYHGLLNKNIGVSISDCKEVEGFDEIFLAFHKDMKKIIKFDSDMFDGWHLYIEDICLLAKINNIRCIVLPYKSQHKNYMEMPGYMHITGIYPSDYFKYLRRLRKKYSRKVDRITCPCITISTKWFEFYFVYTKIYLHMRIRKLFRILSFK